MRACFLRRPVSRFFSSQRVSSRLPKLTWPVLSYSSLPYPPNPFALSLCALLIVLLIVTSFSSALSSPFFVAGREFSPNFPSVARHIYTQLLRIFAHLYHAHYPIFLHLSSEGHLNSLFAHFLTFGREFDLLEEKETRAPKEGWPFVVGDLMDVSLEFVAEPPNLADLALFLFL